MAAILLAAGGARRMGSPKALLPWGGRSLVRHAALTALASMCVEVHVALGSNASALEAEVADLDVKTSRLGAWRDGMGSTLAAAVREISAGLDGVVVLLCDQPFVTPALIDQLIRAGIGHEMAACAYGGTLGPPAFFATSCFERLRELSGERGAKALLLEQPESVATVAFPEGQFDIDEPDDYARALTEFERRTTLTR